MIAPLTGPDRLYYSIVYSLVYLDLTKGVLFTVLLLLQAHCAIRRKNVRISYDTTRVNQIIQFSILDMKKHSSLPF